MNIIRLPNFNRYVGVDYSGAQTPGAGLKGLRVYRAERVSVPVDVLPPAKSTQISDPQGHCPLARGPAQRGTADNRGDRP